MFTPFTETFDRIAVEIKADVILDETLADDNLDEGLHLGQRLAIRAIERHENVKRHEHDCKQESSCSCAWPTTYVQAPTGSGKTMIMVVSAIIKSLKHQRSVILCPDSNSFENACASLKPGDRRFSQVAKSCGLSEQKLRVYVLMAVHIFHPKRSVHEDISGAAIVIIHLDQFHRSLYPTKSQSAPNVKSEELKASILRDIDFVFVDEVDKCSPTSSTSNCIGAAKTLFFGASRCGYFGFTANRMKKNHGDYPKDQRHPKCIKPIYRGPGRKTAELVAHVIDRLAILQADQSDEKCRPLSTAKEVIHHINNHPEALALNIAEYGAELQKYRNLHHASNAQGVIWRVGGGSNKDTFISAFNAAMRQHHTQHPSLYGDSAPLKAIAYHAQLDLKTSVFDFLVADLSLIRAVDHPPLKVGFMLKSNVAGDVILQMVGRLLRHWPEFPHAEAHLFVLPFHVKLLQSVSPLIRSDDQQIPIHASISQFQEEITAEKIDTEIGLLLNLSSPAVIPPPPPLPTAECNILANVAERKILTAPTVVPPPPPLPTAECQALSSPASLPTAQQDNVVVAPVPPTGRTLRPRRSIPVNEQWVDSKPAKKRAKISVKMPKLLDMDIDEGDEGDEAFEMTFSESESSSSESESDDDVYAPESEDSVEEEEDMADDESDGESKGAALISTSDAANIKPKAGKKKRKSTHAISSTTEQHLNLLHESPPECKGCGKRNTIFQGKYRRFLRKKALFGQYTRESEVYARAEYYLPSTTKSGRIINCSTCLVRLKQEAIQARVNTQCEHTDCSVVFIAPPDHGDDVTVGTAKRQKGGLMNEPYMKLRAKLESVSLYPIKEGVVIIGYKSESYCKSHLGNKDAKLDPYSKIRYVPTTEDANTGDWGSVERVALLERTHGEVIKKVHQFQLNTQERQRLFQDEFKPTVKSVIDEDWATSYYQTIVNDRSVVDTPWSALEDETLALFLELVIAQPLQYPVLVLMRDLLENKVLIPDDFLRKVKSERWPGFAIFSIADFMFNASLPLEHPSNQTPLVILNIQGHWQLNPRFDMRLRRALQQQLPNSEPTKTYMDILRDLRPPPVSAEAEVETESDTEAESIPDHRKKRATAKKPTSQLTRDYAHFILAHLTNQWVPRKHLTKCLQANHEQLQMNLHSLKPDQNNNTIVSTWLTKIQAFLHRQIVVRDDHYWKLKQACDFCHQMGSCVCQPQECFCQPCATCNVGHFCKNGKVDNHMCHTGCHACTPRRRAPRFSKESETKDRLNPQAVKKICKFVQLAKLRFGQTPHPRDSWQSLAVEVGITSFSSNFQHLTATTTTLKSAWCFNFPYLVPRENNLFALAPEFFG